MAVQVEAENNNSQLNSNVVTMGICSSVAAQLNSSVSSKIFKPIVFRKMKLNAMFMICPLAAPYLPILHFFECTRIHVDGVQVIDEFLTTMLKFAQNLESEPIDEDTSTLNMETKDGKAGLDIYGASVLPYDSPIAVFIHGGYWLEGSKDYAKSMVKTLVSDGAIVVVLGYKLCPEVTLPQIVDEVIEQLKFIIDWSKKRHYGRKSPIHIIGHSAGAQLSFQALLKLPKEICEYIRSLILISGVYDLQPLIATDMNKSVKIDEPQAHSLSPINFAAEIHKACGAGLKILIVVGEEDAPNFVAQSREFFDVLKQHFDQSEAVSLDILPLYNHFDIIVDLGHKEKSIYKLVYSKIFQ